MKVEVLIAHKKWSVGDIIDDLPDADAAWKIQNGVVREVGAKTPPRKVANK